MASIKTVQVSFAGGEVSPEMFGRIDDTKYQAGLALCKNFIAKAQGAVENRPGFGFVSFVKDSSKRVRLLPFVFSTTQTLVIEMGEGYFRFHTNGATILAPSTAPAYNGASAYTQGSIVLFSGELYYAALAVPAGNSPAAVYTPQPSASASWSQVYGPSTTPPAGFAYLGNVLPPAQTSDAGRFVTTSFTQQGIVGYGPPYSDTFANDYDPDNGNFAWRQDPIYGPITYYVGYQGVSNVAPTGYWFPLGPPGGPLTIPNNYSQWDLFDIDYVQSNDVITFAHQNYPPQELRRLGASVWILQAINFASKIANPGAPSITINNPGAALTNTQTFRYVVTAVASDGFTESIASPPGSVVSNLFVTGVTHSIAWGAVTGAALYNVYKYQGGLYGFIGQTASLTLDDNNIAPDMSKTPPLYDTAFQSMGPGDYPAAVGYFEQRRAFAGSINKPQNLWMTRSGTESDMSYSLPVRDDDRIAFRVATQQANAIRHIIPLNQLLLLTSSAEWRVTSNNSDALTPTTINVKPQSYIGANKVKPAVVNSNIVFCAARGGHVRELAYSWQASGFVTGDLCLRAQHLFDRYEIVDLAYSKAPQSIVWFVSTSGELLGLTYIPEQQVASWHHHSTGGDDDVFESVAVVSEGPEDVLYCVVKRKLNGVVKRTIERMRSRNFQEQADAFFVDCGLTYSGSPATTISGLNHLEGMTVSILADGAVHPQRVVGGGSVTLDQPASKVHIGLPITADIQTLPLAAQLDGAYGQGRMKNVNKAWLRVYRSGGIFVGPDVGHLTEAKQRTTEPYGSAPYLKSQEIPVTIVPTWGDSGQVWIRQADPLPLTLVSLTLEVAPGG